MKLSKPLTCCSFHLLGFKLQISRNCASQLFCIKETFETYFSPIIAHCITTPTMTLQHHRFKKGMIYCFLLRINFPPLVAVSSPLSQSIAWFSSSRDCCQEKLLGEEMFTQRSEGYLLKMLQWVFSMQEAEPSNFLSSLKLILYAFFLVPGHFPPTSLILRLLVLDISTFLCFLLHSVLLSYESFVRLWSLTVCFSLSMCITNSVSRFTFKFYLYKFQMCYSSMTPHLNLTSAFPSE